MGKHEQSKPAVAPEHVLEQTLSDYVHSPVNNEPDCCDAATLASKVNQVDRAYEKRG